MSQVENSFTGGQSAAFADVRDFLNRRPVGGHQVTDEVLQYVESRLAGEDFVSSGPMEAADKAAGARGAGDEVDAVVAGAQEPEPEPDAPSGTEEASFAEEAQ